MRIIESDRRQLTPQAQSVIGLVILLSSLYGSASEILNHTSSLYHPRSTSDRWIAIWGVAFPPVAGIMLMWEGHSRKKNR